jgi:hypothetical protein
MGRKSLLVLVIAVLGGLAFVGDRTTQLAISRCQSLCPERPDALKTVINVGPLHLKICNCGKPDVQAHGEEFLK